ncbi:MAG: hypothetical protein KDD85_06185 [Parvularculaceae bacterium]|nr:hypothetical protein [Parvularculaceae bacterium]
MISALIQKAAIPAFAAIAAAGGGLIASVEPHPPSAYLHEANFFEVSSAARAAEASYSRADLNNDGHIDQDEYVTLAIVSAELFRLNGFVALETTNGALRVSIAAANEGALADKEKASIRARARAEYARLAGDDQKLSEREFVDSKVEEFYSADIDRNGVLTGAELKHFAFAQTRIGLLVG